MENRRRSFLDRNLEHYPSNSRRIWYLALSVAATFVLYYEAYVLPSVATLIIVGFRAHVRLCRPASRPRASISAPRWNRCHNSFAI